MKKALVLNIFLAIMFIGCCNEDDSPQPPERANLVFPESESECTTGQHVSATESLVTFRWDESLNTSSYILNVTDLATQTTNVFNTTSTSFSVTLNKGEAYSWFVTSSSEEFLETPQSETWRFYNAGDGIESYAPFPASIVGPSSGQKLVAANVNLIWQGSDVDNDIVEYNVYLENVNPPTTIIGANLTEESLRVSTLTPGVYYWKVISEDALGNTSESLVSQFSVE